LAICHVALADHIGSKKGGKTVLSAFFDHLVAFVPQAAVQENFRRAARHVVFRDKTIGVSGVIIVDSVGHCIDGTSHYAADANAISVQASVLEAMRECAQKAAVRLYAAMPGYRPSSSKRGQ
jgi:hypothetical protein